MTDRKSDEASTNRSGMFVRVVPPTGGDTLGAVSAVRDLFIINGKDSGGVPARILEIISPGGFERAFREMHALGDDLNPEAMMTIAEQYGVDVDFERTTPIIEPYGLRF